MIENDQVWVSTLGVGPAVSVGNPVSKYWPGGISRGGSGRRNPKNPLVANKDLSYSDAALCAKCNRQTSVGVRDSSILVHLR